jgi:hypothetical protein
MRLRHLKAGELFRFARSSMPHIYEVVDPSRCAYRMVGIFMSGVPHIDRAGEPMEHPSARERAVRRVTIERDSGES